ncbi:hypothetical protein F4818DRAFT_126480 [Hypoxylon cercidicola]|nr:hypothetical protein F4818DRAFT_126480 [Hypoxylon cercidicola]
MRSPLGAILGDLYTPKVEDLSGGPTDARLIELGSKLPVVPESRIAYAQVMMKLRMCYYLSDRANTRLNRKNAALRFPLLMGSKFLAQRSPAALMVMAFWCVLLHRAEDILKIGELVPFEYVRLIIAWPMEKVASVVKNILDPHSVGN